MSSLRSLPSVEQMLNTTAALDFADIYGRPLTLEAVRTALDEARENYPQTGTVPDNQELLARVRVLLETWVTPTLLPVINATGVILHTNLGRSPLSRGAIRAAEEAALEYSNLEYDLGKGKRGSRLHHAEALLRRLTGAEAAVVVNNNAAAVMLVLTALAKRRGVVIARSQMVEIGGGFRIPDVMKQSGAKLVEIGTTNRVHVQDYVDVIEEKPALVMRAHRSNFQIIGFTSEPELAEIATVTEQAGVPLLDDLGSGSLLDTAGYGLGHEPMVQESLDAGADLVCFSGDKLLGGPQAGIVVGRADLVSRLKKHPLARAVRADKLCLAALSATLLHYIKDEAESEIPIWRMIAAKPSDIQSQAERWADILGMGTVIAGESTVGGGSLPGETLPTYLLVIKKDKPSRFLRQLRGQRPPVIARTQDDKVLIDPRTVLPKQEEELLAALRSAMAA